MARKKVEENEVLFGGEQRDIDEIILTSVVVSHADVMANHVGHCAGQKMRLIHIHIHADAHSTGRTNSFGNSHASLTASECFATERDSIYSIYVICEYLQVDLSISCKCNLTSAAVWYLVRFGTDFVRCSH